MSKLRLGINIDHVATIRNARGGLHPDPVRAAILAAEAGADGAKTAAISRMPTSSPWCATSICR